MGYAAVTGTLSWATVALYGGGVAWTLVYDTIYAMQDQRDDAIDRRALDRAALRRRAAPLAHAVRRGDGCGLGAGWPSRASSAYYFGVLLLIALHFAWQIAFLKPDDQADCLAKFKSNGQSACC